MPREHDRIPYLTEIVLESSSGKREARISDLGPGGCYIDSIAAVHEGEKVSFDIVMADVQMNFSGEVAYAFPGNGFGVRFTDLTDDKREFIRRAMDAG